MKKEDLEPILFSEEEVGIEERLKALEAAYQKSCEHNGVELNDFEYFRKYIFILFCAIDDGIETVKKSKEKFYGRCIKCNSKIEKPSQKACLTCGFGFEYDNDGNLIDDGCSDSFNQWKE